MSTPRQRLSEPIDETPTVEVERAVWVPGYEAGARPDPSASPTDELLPGRARASPVPASIRSRRQTAVIRRRRRLALVDAVLGVCLGLLFVLAGFGLAPVGILALAVLALCAASYAASWRRRARRRR